MNSSQATPAESSAPPVAVHKLLTGQKALVTARRRGASIWRGEAGVLMRSNSAQHFASPD